MLEPIETSLDQGSPIELYEFRMGTRSWYYTSHAQDIEIDLLTWKAVAISRGAIEATSDVQRNSVAISMPRDLDVPELFRTSPPSGVVTLTIYAVHLTDVDLQRVAIWKGRVINVTWRGIKAELSTEPVFTSLKRTGLRRNYQRQCPHMLYSDACGLSQVTYELNGTATNASGAVLTIPAANGYSDGWFAGGMLTSEITPGVVTRRSIREHTGDQITITLAIPDLVAGQAVKLYPGCDHTITTCRDKFSNELNYGGWPYIPVRNPFGGGPVF